jgi:hypothetical protein
MKQKAEFMAFLLEVVPQFLWFWQVTLSFSTTSSSRLAAIIKRKSSCTGSSASLQSADAISNEGSGSVSCSSKSP